MLLHSLYQHHAAIVPRPRLMLLLYFPSIVWILWELTFALAGAGGVGFALLICTNRLVRNNGQRVRAAKRIV